MKDFVKTGLFIVLILIGLFLIPVSAEEIYQQTITMPWGMNFAFDSKNNIFLTVYNENIIKKFDSNGNFIREWRIHASGDGQSGSPWGIAVDSEDNVYVSDIGNYRIQKFNSDGLFIKEWKCPGKIVSQFPTSKGPFGLATDNIGNVYAVDKYGNKIQKFDSYGNFITEWGSYGTADGQFNSPFMIATDNEDNVYVSDSGNNRIQKFDSNGKFITKWGSYGTADGQFNSPSGIAIDDQDIVYVVESHNWRICKFTSNGIFITKWSIPKSGSDSITYLMGCGVSHAGLVYQTDMFNQLTRVYKPPNVDIAYVVMTPTSSPITSQSSLVTPPIFPVTRPSSISTEKSLRGKTAIVILFHNNDVRKAWIKTQQSIDWIEEKTNGEAKFEVLSIGGTLTDAKFVDNEVDAITIRDSIDFKIIPFGDGVITNMNEILQGITVDNEQMKSEGDLITKVKNFGKNRGGYDNVIILLSDYGMGSGLWIGNLILIKENILTDDLPEYAYGHEILHYFGAVDNYNKRFILPKEQDVILNSIMWYTTEDRDKRTPIQEKMLDTESETELGLRPELGLIVGNFSFDDNNVFVVRYLPILGCSVGNIGKSEYNVFIYDMSRNPIGNYFFKFDVCELRYDYAVALPPGDYYIQLSSEGYESSTYYPITVKAGETNNELKNKHHIILKRNSGWLIAFG